MNSMANNVTAKDIEPFGDIAAEIEHLAWTHGIDAEPEPVDAFAATVSRLCDQDVKLDRIEMLLVKLQRAGLIDGIRGVELHAAYLRQHPINGPAGKTADRSPPSAPMLALMAEMERAAAVSSEQRRATGEVLTYQLDGWMVRESPGGRIERLCPVEAFRAADYPQPGFTPPTKR